METSLTQETREAAARCEKIFFEMSRRARQSVLAGLSPCPAIREKLDEYLRHLRVTRKRTKQTIHDKRRVLLRFAAELGSGAGDIAVDRITETDLETWAEKRLLEPGYGGKTVSRRTVAKDIKILKAFCHWARRRFTGSRNMAALGYEFYCPPDGQHGGKVDAITVAEFINYAARIGRVSRHAALVLYAMLYFGARPQALFLLDFADTSLPENGHPGRAKLAVLKKGDPGDVPVPEGSPREGVLLEAELLARKYHGRVRRSWPVFTTRRGQSKRRPRGWCVDTYANELRRCANKARVPGEFVAYVVRHSAVTWLKQEGVAVSQIQHYAKHSRQETQGQYDHTSGELAREAYEVVEELTGAAFFRFRREGSGC